MAQRQFAPQGKWFFKDGDKRREFTDILCLGCNDEQYQLCTDAEKQEWINSHKEDYSELFELEENEQV